MSSFVLFFKDKKDAKMLHVGGLIAHTFLKSAKKEFVLFSSHVYK